MAGLPSVMVRISNSVVKNLKPTMAAVSTAASMVVNQLPQPKNTEQSMETDEREVEARVTIVEPLIIDIPVVREVNDIPLAYHKHEYDAGYDLYSIEDVWFWPFQTKIVRTNVRMQIPPGFQLRLAGRSGMTSGDWWTHHGTIDCGYIGNIGVIMKNMKPWPRRIKRGQRITQAVLWPIVYMDFVEVKELEMTTRGDKGFGASGRF